MLASTRIKLDAYQDLISSAKIDELSRSAVIACQNNDLNLTISYYQNFFEETFGYRNDEWNPYRYPGILD